MSATVLASGTWNAAGSRVLTLATTPRVGQRLILVVVFSTGTPGPTVADSKGNTWTLDNQPSTQQSSPSTGTAIYSCLPDVAPLAAGDTITLTTAGTYALAAVIDPGQYVSKPMAMHSSSHGLGAAAAEGPTPAVTETDVPFAFVVWANTAATDADIQSVTPDDTTWTSLADPLHTATRWLQVFTRPDLATGQTASFSTTLPGANASTDVWLVSIGSYPVDPTPSVTLTFEEGADGANLTTGTTISAVSSPAPFYSAAAALHGALGVTGSGTSAGPTFTVTKPANFTDPNGSNTVSLYYEPVTGLGGALQVCAWQAADNSAAGLLRFNVNTKKIDISVNGTATGSSALVWSTGTKYRCDVTFDYPNNRFTVKVFAGVNVEGSVPDDTFTAAGSGAAKAFDHWYFSPSRSTTAGCQGYLDTIRCYDGLVSPVAFNPPINSSATLKHSWVGAPTTGGFRVKAHLTGATSVKLAVSANADMSLPIYSAASAPDANGYVDFTMTGLNSGTRYYYQLVDTPGGGLPTSVGSIARARTLPSTNSHRVAFGSCVTQNATDPAAFNDIVGWDPDLFIHLGDFDYSGDESTDYNHQRTTYETQIAGVNGLTNLMANVPWAYGTSDHEAGPDNGDSNNAYTAANITAYKQIVPTYALADTRTPTAGRYQTWVVGRVRYILLDIRNTDRSPGANADDATKTMLGAVQKAWLKNQLLAAEPVKVILSDVAWLGAASLTNGVDKWWSYSTERQEIADFITANNVKALLWHGDSHTLAVASPAKNTWGGFPVYCAAPLHNTGGGRNLSSFDSYYDNAGANCRQYGRVTVTDTGTAISFAYSGWDATNQVERIAQVDTFQLTDVTPPSVPSIVSATPVAPDQINLTWTASTDDTGVASYRVQRDGVTVADGLTATAWNDTTVVASTTYSYTISAIDVAGNRSAESNPALATTPAVADTTPPTTPTGAVATVLSSTAVQLTWLPSSDDTGVTGYRVLRDGATVVGSGLTGTSFTDNTVSAGGDYVYTISARDAAGNRSPESLPVSVSVPAQPSQVPGLTTVTHRLLDIDGTPLVNRTITITLMLRTDVAPESYQINAPDPFSGQPIARYVAATSDANGFLSWNLVPNDQIVPTGTYYEVYGLGSDRTFLYVPSSAVSMELSEVTLTLVDLNGSNLVLVQGPRGRQGDDGTGNAGITKATASTVGGILMAGDLAGDASAPSVVSGAHHGHTSAQISDASAVTAPDSVVIRDDTGQAGFSYVTLDQQPVDTDHAVPKSYADGLGTPSNDSDSIVRRDADGSFNVQRIVSWGGLTPLQAEELVRQDYVDQQVGTRAAIAGDLGGTPDLPTVPALSNKSNVGHTHGEADIAATGTRDSTTFLRGDGTWAVPPTGGGSSGLPVKNGESDMTAPLTDYFVHVEVLDDGSATASWPNRMEFAYTPVGGSRGLTTYLNEYGELRVEPAKSSTVAARFFTKHAPTDPAHTANVFEVMDDRTTRTVLFSIDASGNVTAANLPPKIVASSTAPASPAVGTLWVDLSS